MEALRRPLAAEQQRSIHSPDAPAPNEYWEKLCADKNYLRRPLGQAPLLYRAARGNATAITITEIICDLTHGQQARKSGGRPEWTQPLATEYFADCLNVDVRSVQLALNQLCGENGEPAILARRIASGRRYQYRAQPWLWETLADAAAGKTAGASPTSDHNESSGVKPSVLVMDEPIIAFAGKKPRSMRLSEAVREALPTVKFLRFEASDATLSFTSRIEAGELLVSASLFHAELSHEAKERRSSAQFASLQAPKLNNLGSPVSPLSANDDANDHSAPKPVLASNTSSNGVPAQLKSAIDAKFAAAIGQAIDAAKLRETVTALGDDPRAIPLFVASLDHKARKILANGSYGLLPRLAEAARDAAPTIPSSIVLNPGCGHSPATPAEVEADIREIEARDRLELEFDQFVEGRIGAWRQYLVTSKRPVTPLDYSNARQALRAEWEKQGTK